MKKAIDRILRGVLLVTLLFLAGSFGYSNQVSAQSPTIGESDAGTPKETVDPILPTQPAPDGPALDLPPLTGGSPDLETQGSQPFDSLPELMPAACLQGPGAWELKTPLSTPTHGAAVASDGVYVYVAGGEDSGGVSNRFARYDPQQDRWTNLAPLPTAVREALAIYAEGKIFVLGGVNSAGFTVNLIQIYAIASNSWAAGASMPGVRSHMSGGYHMGILFAVGGYETSEVSSRNQNWAYSISANSWAIKAAMPAALGGAGSEMINGHLYIIGGRDETHDSLNTVYDYSVGANSWSARTPIPIPVNYPGTAAYLNRIWVFGGGAPFTGMTDTQIYDPTTNAWSVGPALNSGRSFQDGVAVRNKIVSIGGWSTTYSNAVEVATQPELNVLIVYSDAGVRPATLQFDLMAQSGIGQVDVFDGQLTTPTLGQLQAYDIVVPFSDTLWMNAAALGDVLANFLDAGGVVVALDFDWTSGYDITGLWQSSGYSPFTTSTGFLFSDVSLGTIQRPGHPLLAGVEELNVYYRTQVALASAAVLVASWSDATPALAYKGRAVGINAYIGDYPKRWSGDYAAVIANAGFLLRSGSPACTSLSCQGPSLIEGAITSTDLTQSGRLFRADPPSTCAAPQSCAVNDANLRHYDVYPFINNTASVQCVSVTLDPACGGSLYVQSAAYLGSFNPSGLCDNFLADIGATSYVSKSYSFSVSAWQSYSVVVNEVEPNTYCSGYKLIVTPGNCEIKDVYLPLIRR